MTPRPASAAKTADRAVVLSGGVGVWSLLFVVVPRQSGLNKWTTRLDH